MSKGFYGWIRDGVRRAVLLGVSDAVEQLGSPDDQQDISPHLLAVLRNEKPLLAGEPASAAPFAPSRSRSERKRQETKRSEPKRLGKSFAEIAKPAPQAT
jgi:hypothetical protein